MGFDYPWHPYFLWWFVMLVVGPRPSLFWRRTSLHHLGYLGSLFSLSKLPKFARCYAYGIAEATRNACHAIKGAGPIQSSKNLHIHSCDFMIWIADTFSQGHYPAEHILLIPFARFCFDCACNVELLSFVVSTLRLESLKAVIQFDSQSSHACRCPVTSSLNSLAFVAVFLYISCRS